MPHQVGKTMEDKYKLACVSVVSLVGYGCVALITGHNGSVMTGIVATVAAIIAGTVGYAIHK